MTVRSRTKQALAMLLPVGVLGISAALASLQGEALNSTRSEHRQSSSVAERLSEIRSGVSAIDKEQQTNLDADGVLLAAWPNWGGGFGWRNGGWGWHNGWHNGGWGWHNGGWGNGGWGNGGWGNGGWHNWHNFWHNW